MTAEEGGRPYAVVVGANSPGVTAPVLSGKSWKVE